MELAVKRVQLFSLGKMIEIKNVPFFCDAAGRGGCFSSSGPLRSQADQVNSRTGQVSRHSHIRTIQARSLQILVADINNNKRTKTICDGDMKEEVCGQ